MRLILKDNIGQINLLFDYSTLIPDEKKSKFSKIESAELPSYFGSTDGRRWVIDAVGVDRLKELQSNGAKVINAKLKVGIHGHEYLNNVLLYTLIGGTRYTIQRNDRHQEIEWKPFVVNGEPHIFSNSYRFSIEELLKCEDLVTASLKREEEYIRAQLPLDSAPQFQGGDIKKFREWILMQLSYPKEMFENKIEGEVFVNFIINKEGVLGDIKILKSPHEKLSDVVVGIVQKSPLWTPAQFNGEAVDSRLTVPVTFKLK
ncbi:MAG: energy transducer TonB [Rikenellaceae bacterium]